ncbi:cysteine-rich VLP protein [Streptomyces californicus]|uniref:cysteine-rich VLP protein n=1 Tax=Streptomyces californicus TaxID=67351 RepID=UPI0036470F04
MEKEIKKLIRNACANYSEGNCLLLDKACPLVSGGNYRGKEITAKDCSCTYFQKAVLPANATLEAYYYGQETLNKTCKGCGKGFYALANKSMYCSDLCRKSANKKSHRKYNQKRA